MLRGLPRRDDSYDIRDPACIYDNEYLQRKVHADGDETTFTFGVLVFDSYGQFVFEHANGIGKINAMLLRFDAAFAGSHSYSMITLCTLYVHCQA